MISIIISSYQHHFFEQISKNISQTIGNKIEYEIVKIWNPGKMGICKAYNSGAEQSKYDNLLFVHEDVLFNDNNWGEKLLHILQLPNCGVVGVAGGDYYSYVPGSWWNSGHKFLHFIQTDNNGQQFFNNRCNFSNNATEIPVKSLDGVFLACTKKVYNSVKFNENITGFHGYDLIFSLEAAKKYTNFVTDQILINHFSTGSISKEWLHNILKVRAIIGIFSTQKIDINVEIENFYKLIALLKNLEFSRFESFKIILKYLNPQILGLKNTLKIINRTKHLL
ncbi:hypothetical protein AB670_03125 [Chryseobacterium sp. MOF25P]|uniref:glycosyltransferase n=1 Tax=unclassified Chryseobacterium TaxID=2593645 RepID=UPI000804A4AB|nr:MULTISPECIES: glycosyltransferase [unclassified Chryseobacterium]OBW40658.1 hypothetical protein AB670_03125 [Chryseobacterium sp. MOF25P]OBW44791.1 hypothetical protein AB671_03235 [Chryseobacterium sp. BGARF1]